MEQERTLLDLLDCPRAGRPTHLVTVDNEVHLDPALRTEQVVQTRAVADRLGADALAADAVAGIFAAKERVVLSWVGRDALTGEPIEPSPVVLELALWLASSGVGAPLRVEVGTDRFSAVVPATKDTPSVVLLGAKDEARASALLDRFRAAAGRAPTLAEIRSSTRDWSREAQAGVERALGIPEIRGPLEVAPQSTVRISELRDFLLDPVQGSARFLLGRARREQDGDLFYRDEELLSSRPSGRSSHLVVPSRTFRWRGRRSRRQLCWHRYRLSLLSKNECQRCQSDADSGAKRYGCRIDLSHGFPPIRSSSSIADIGIRRSPNVIGDRSG